jgi:hypothetical protein
MPADATHDPKRRYPEPGSEPPSAASGAHRGRPARLGAHRGLRTRPAPHPGRGGGSRRAGEAWFEHPVALPGAAAAGGLLGVHRRPLARPGQRGGEHTVRSSLLLRAGLAAALHHGGRGELPGRIRFDPAGRGARVPAARSGPASRGTGAVPGRGGGAGPAVFVPRAERADLRCRAPVRRNLPRPRSAAGAHPGRLVHHSRGRRLGTAPIRRRVPPRSVARPRGPRVRRVRSARPPLRERADRPGGDRGIRSPAAGVRVGRRGAQAVSRVGAEGGAPAAAPRPRPDRRLHHPGDGKRLGPALRTGGCRPGAGARPERRYRGRSGPAPPGRARGRAAGPAGVRRAPPADVDLRRRYPGNPGGERGRSPPLRVDPRGVRRDDHHGPARPRRRGAAGGRGGRPAPAARGDAAAVYCRVRLSQPVGP